MHCKNEIWRVFGEIEAKKTIGKSSEIGFVIGGMTTMSVNCGGFRTKMSSLAKRKDPEIPNGCEKYVKSCYNIEECKEFFRAPLVV
ncbi:hypothetical protein NPIL_450021 [Nephila pilipes]|uniref:Uncharacterized protein n=1 Tax=Nephila pilipes TaxID=299642 RepID=A0A8X6QVP3_NEPPI|nr:hypothetical protein NPIL_450021 [Nephila pilipes]